MAMNLATLQKEVLKDDALTDLMAQRYADHLQQIVRSSGSMVALFEALKDEAKSDAWSLAEHISIRDLVGGSSVGKKSSGKGSGSRSGTVELTQAQVTEIQEMYAADPEVSVEQIKERLGAELDGRRINKVLRSCGAAVPSGGRKAKKTKAAKK